MKFFNFEPKRLKTKLALITLAISSCKSFGQVDGDDFIQFDHFIADNTNMKCWADEHVTMFNDQVRGTCLGGWMVLEPWITPSLFYQFLGKDEKSAAGDIFNFCKVLGPEEGNTQLRRHWESWVTEDIIQELAEQGSINSLRLPVGDWMYKPYGPYVGCTDGALDYVDRLLGWAEKYNLSVLIDIHGVRGSQNGFDNSGQSMGFEWTSVLNTEPKGLVTFEHWPIRSAGWMGKFDREAANYTTYDEDNVNFTLEVIQDIVDMYKDHPAVYGLEPVNEPWEFTPIDRLKQFYWEGYLIVKKSAPTWKYIIHDSFRFDPNVWGGFMSGCPDRAIDTHIYQAWNFPTNRESFYDEACSQKYSIADMENAFGPVIVGEWSLATDNCAMWLNGFNDNLSGYPMLPCRYIPCPDPYMGFDQPGTPVDPARPIQGPFGTGMSGPSYGMCPIGRDWSVETTANGTNWMHAPPEAPHGLDDTDVVMRNLALRKLNAFAVFGHGFYFWNFRTELNDPQWSYMLAIKKGWLTTQNLDDKSILNACEKEDTAQYKCVCKSGMLEKNVQNALMYVFNVQGNKTDFVSYAQSLHGENLTAEADVMFNQYWLDNRVTGATCDFGGVAQLVALNYTYVPPPEPKSAAVQAAFRPLVALGIGVGFILFMIMFAVFVFRIGGYMREKNLRSLGAIRKSFAGLYAESENSSLLR